MNLYIGGYGQGKLQYVLNQVEKSGHVPVFDGEKTDFPRNKAEMVHEANEQVVLFHHFHLWVRHLLQEGKNPEEETEKLLECFPDCLIICDEIGNGIVPIDAFERTYRDAVGGMQILLAKKAERVERILCGMGQILK